MYFYNFTCYKCEVSVLEVIENMKLQVLTSHGYKQTLEFRGIAIYLF